MVVAAAADVWKVCFGEVYSVTSLAEEVDGVGVAAGVEAVSAAADLAVAAEVSEEVSAVAAISAAVARVAVGSGTDSACIVRTPNNYG